MQWVFVNGGFVESDEARVPALDRGLLYGYGLFETMRARCGRVFRLDEHHRRLSQGALALGIALPLAVDDLRTAIEEIARRNALEDARVRLTVTAGPTRETGSAAPSVLLTAAPVSDYPRELYEKGMAAITSAVRRNETSPLSRIKSLNCLDNVLARDEARRRGADHAILLNTQGLVAEGSSSNLFLAQGDRLLTPTIASGALPGITRAAVLDLAQGAGIDCTEVEITPEMLAGSDEAFLTGAVMGVMPLTRIDGKALGDGRPGPLTRAIRRLYEQAAARETAR